MSGAGLPEKLALRLMIVAVEPSGDALGAALLREIRATFPPGVHVSGCGGPLMEAAGLRSLFPIEPLSVMGFTDVARALPLGMKRAEELTARVVAEQFDAVVFVDGWAFSRIAAEKMRKRAPEAKLFKLAAPQVWASRQQRVDFVKKHFDGVLCLLPFEPPYFERVGVPAAFIGNPNFQAAWRARGDGREFRRRCGLRDAPLLVVLPGSRKSEIKRHMKPFGEAVRMLKDCIPDLRIAVALPPALEGFSRPEIESWPGDPIFVPPAEKSDAFAAADAALAKSGTVTTELAINGAAMVVAYRVDPLTAVWARLVVTTKFATILNIVAGRMVVPELLQEKCRAEFLAADLLALLTDRELRLEQTELFPALLARLGVDGPPAERLGALKLAEWLGVAARPRGDTLPGE